MKTHRVTGGGNVLLHVEETGNPGGRPILFIHGFSQCRLAWNKQMRSDLARDFRLIAMDIRGHGLSAKPKDGYSDSRLWADDVHAVITALGLEQPVICGWSYGGVVMCDYVCYYGEERVGGLHFAGAASRLGEPLMSFLGQEFLGVVPGFFSCDVEESAATFQKFLRLCVHEAPTPEDFYFFLGYNTIVPPSVRVAMFDRTLEYDDLLASLRKPVLITHGRDDAIVLLSMAQRHAEIIRHAQTSYYRNIGHMPFWEDPERFNRELRAFVVAL